MARLPRLSRPGIVHYVLQRGHNGGAIVHDDRDIDALLQTLREAARSSGVTLHAHAVSGSDLRILATPDSEAGISRMMQSVGRRYAASFNRRHVRSGSLWDGRFRAALIEPGEAVLSALRHVEGSVPQPEPDAAREESDRPQLADRTTAPVSSSAPHHAGRHRDPALVDPPAYWALGNTPFERESRYRQLLAEPLAAPVAAAITHAVQGCWAWGSPAFLQELSALTARPPAPRPRGRPRRG